MDKKKELKSTSQSRLLVLRQLLREGTASTQEEIVKALKHKKFNITQSTTSRDLRRVGAIKTTNTEGEIVYKLPDENTTAIPMTVSDSLGRLLLDVTSNESMIILHTSPGSASLVARHIDSMRSSLEILGTIAGDDTIFIAPASTKKISAIIENIKGEF